MIDPDKEIVEAWGRLLNDCAHDGDGEKALIWLRRMQLDIPPMNAETCAVHDHNGARRLAATIINFAVTSENARSERSDYRTDADHQRARRRYADEHGGRRSRGAERRVPERSE